MRAEHVHPDFHHSVRCMGKHLLGTQALGSRFWVYLLVVSGQLGIMLPIECIYPIFLYSLLITNKVRVLGLQPKGPEVEAVAFSRRVDQWHEVAGSSLSARFFQNHGLPLGLHVAPKA